jgi:hypothetical protein
MMVLGNHTFTMNPATATLPIKRRMGLPVETLTGVEIFSWGVIIAGVKLTLTWEFMPTTSFDAIEALYVADMAYTFNPENGHTYNVEITNLQGSYHIDPTANAPHRRDVTLELLIVSQLS